jgi:flagellar hook-associated protein 1 FlgK
MDQSTDNASRAALMDQRDRLVGQIAEIIDVRVDYRSDDTVSLMTSSGVGLLDGKPSTFTFASAGTLSAGKQFDPDPNKSTVGRLALVTPSGLSIDVAQQGVLQSGTLGALLKLRDDTLVKAQDQLDEIAAGLAQAFSTTNTGGTAATAGAKNGFSIDLSAIRDGNDLVVAFTKGGVDKTVRVVRVDDTSKLPLDYVDANGARVIGVDFSGGAAAVAAKLSAALGNGFTVSGVGTSLTVLDDGALNNTDVGALTARSTSSGLQDGDPAFSLFVDRGNTDFTNSLGGAGQKLGFAGRIGVNSAILTDNTLLVRSSPGGSLGDPSRANYVLGQLGSMTFASGQSGPEDASSFRLGGTVNDLISQTMNYTGSITQSASSDDETNQLTMASLGDRMDTEYGVNVDEEMARLLELQNAYAANSRIIAAVQDLMRRLMDL